MTSHGRTEEPRCLVTVTVIHRPLMPSKGAATGMWAAIQIARDIFLVILQTRTAGTTAVCRRDPIPVAEYMGAAKAWLIRMDTRMQALRSQALLRTLWATLRVPLRSAAISQAPRDIRGAIRALVASTRRLGGRDQGAVGGDDEPAAELFQCWVFFVHL